MTQETAPRAPASLVDFLLARIAEDEASARGIPAGAWEDATATTRRYDHVFRWSPERVLAECAAKRRVVEGYRAWFGASESELSDDRYYGWLQGLEEAAQHLASVYADHPDYRPEWAPGYQAPPPTAAEVAEQAAWFDAKYELVKTPMGLVRKKRP